MPGAPSFAQPGLRPLTGASGRKVAQVLDHINTSNNASWVKGVKQWVDSNADYIKATYGGDAYAQLSDAVNGRIANFDIKGGKSAAQALPSPLTPHPFEAALNFINRPGEAILGGMDASLKTRPKGESLLRWFVAPEKQSAQSNKAVRSAVTGALKGTQAIPGGEVVRDMGNRSGIAQAVLGTGLEFVTNPLTYAPLGDILKPLKAIAGPIADAFAQDGVIDTSKLSPKAAAAVEKAYGAAHELGYQVERRFARFAFFPKAAKEIWQDRDATTAARINALHDAVKSAIGDYVKATGKALGKDDGDELMKGVTYHVEDKYYRPQLLAMGREIPKGTQFAEGTPEYDLAEKLHAITQDVTDPEVDLGLRNKDLPGYVRHLNLDYRQPTMYGTLGSEAQGMLHAQQFKQARSLLDTVEHMNAEGGNWEANWLQSMGPRLEASIRSQETQTMMNKLLAGARYVSPKAMRKLDYSALAKAGQGVYRADSLRMFPAQMLQNALRYLSPEELDSTSTAIESPTLIAIHPGDIKSGVAVARQGGYILPRAVADSLRETGRRYVQTGLSGILDELNGAWKWGMTRLPFFHMHNILYNAYLGDGGMLLSKRFYQAIQDVAKPEDSEIYQRAVKSGAISDWTEPLVRPSLERDKQVLQSIQRLGGKQPNVLQKAGQVMQDALWQTDKVMRVSLFRKALESGSTDREAANFVNKFMVDYRDLTPFERDTMRTLFPFYAWQRHNIPIQFESWLQQTGKQMLPLQAVQNLNYVLSGDDAQMAQGKPGAPYDVLAPTSIPGQLLATNLNVPAKDPEELIDEGPLDFLFNRATPLATLPVELQTDMPDPFEGPGSYGQTTFYTPTEPEAPQRVPAFGTTGPMIDPRWQVALNAIGTPLQALSLPLSQLAQTPQAARMAGVSPATQAVLQALGFYPGTYNPQKAAYDNAYVQYLQQENLKTLLRRYLRDYGTSAPTPYTP